MEKGEYDPLRISQITTRLRYLFESVEDAEEKEKLRWECIFFDFVITEGLVKPKYTNVKPNGEIWEYPSFNDLTLEGYAYLIDRSNKVKNELLIIQYNQILWRSPSRHKNQKQAKKIIDASFEYVKRNYPIKDNQNSRQLFGIIKNGLSLAKEINYKLNSYLEFIHNLLYNVRQLIYEDKYVLVSILSDLALLKKAEYNSISELLSKISANAKRKNNLLYVKYCNELGLSIAQKFSLDNKIWLRRLGNFYVKSAEDRMNDETKIIPLDFYKKAIGYYKQAGAKQAVKKTEEKYNKLKKHLNLKSVPIQMDDDSAREQVNTIKTIADKLLENSSVFIFGYLSHGLIIFPDKKTLDAVTSDSGSAFLDMVVTVKFDINNNIIGQAGKSAKKERFNELYSLFFQNHTIPILHHIFVNGYLKGSINYDSILDYLGTKTWFRIYFQESKKHADEKYSWLNLLWPSLNEFFAQLEAALKSPNSYSNFILPIDSLVLKFEGALRDFASLLGISTTISGKKNVLREKYIEEILADKNIKDYFNEDDVLFFNYLFVSKDGFNLRNNIAHAFFKFYNYSPAYMYLLICAFLRLGKYNIKPKNDH
ncbi:MAG: DUF4209 domain-containing protein [Proteobacteria bacterium]|nr:DUF4209 domain-containing protein [Pseudomonadota bacterium]